MISNQGIAEAEKNSFTAFFKQSPVKLHYRGRNQLFENRIQFYNPTEGSEESGTPLGEYAYNALGQRVMKDVNGETTIFHYDINGNLIAEGTLDGTITKEYLYMGKIRMAMVDVGSQSFYYFLNDRLGTPQLMTDDTGTVIWEAIYKPFGEALVHPQATVVNNFRFPGQYYDEETRIHYNYHRYYDPRIGKYLTPDPIGLLGGNNLYIYAMNSPINQIDPMGLDPARLRKFAMKLSPRKDLTDVNKLALMMDFAKRDNKGDTYNAVNDLADVLTGGVPTIRERSPHYVGYSAFGSTGFKSGYYQRGNQLWHFVGSLVTGYYRGIPVGILMVYLNEFRFGQPLTGPDISLGVVGVDMGANLNKITDWGEAIRKQLEEPEDTSSECEE